MEIKTNLEGRTLTLLLEGELDHHGARELMEGMDRLIEQNLPAKTILDLEGLTFMDSSGIAVLLRALRQMERHGGTLRAANIPAQARRVLDAAGVGRLIPFD